MPTLGGGHPTMAKQDFRIHNPSQTHVQPQDSIRTAAASQLSEEEDDDDSSAEEMDQAPRSGMLGKGKGDETVQETTIPTRGDTKQGIDDSHGSRKYEDDGAGHDALLREYKAPKGKREPTPGLNTASHTGRVGNV
ncbi:hypothetical protein Pelo_15709 [Pelomyxa schiedti]|nr:hypothetical protein Pelo_15709 [Pelomyxa schiedti]